MWLDSHCHLDAPEFAARLPLVVEAAAKNLGRAILVPAVEVADFAIARDLAHQYAEVIPGLVYTLGIHPLYMGRAQDTDLKVLATAVEKALDDPRFVGIGEIGLDYFVEGLDPKRQAFFFEAQLDLAQQLNLPVIMHVRRSQDAILKALRQRKITGGIAPHDVNWQVKTCANMHQASIVGKQCFGILNQPSRLMDICLAYCRNYFSLMTIF